MDKLSEGENGRFPIYQITVEGSIDQSWSTWFDRLTISREKGCTVLTGPFPDQAALRGVLIKLFDLRLTLISVTRLDK